MLTKLTVRNFKSLVDVSVEFPRLAVLFGPNAAGKSNLLDAIAALSGIGNVSTLSDVLDRPMPVRGHWLETVRHELGEWCTHYLDPGLAMRAPRAPADVFDIGAYGEDIGPFLYKLRAEESSRFEAVSRTLRSIVPSVESLTVQLDERRGTLDILIRQGGVDWIRADFEAKGPGR